MFGGVEILGEAWQARRTQRWQCTANRIYRGRIVHKDKHYPGAHEAIVDEALWDAVQRQLAANRIACATGTHGAEPSLLAGLIYDDSGQRMTPSHANKKGTRYRYYVSQALVSGREGASGVGDRGERIKRPVIGEPVGSRPGYARGWSECRS